MHIYYRADLPLAPWQRETVIHEWPDGERVLLEDMGVGYGKAATELMNANRPKPIAKCLTLDAHKFHVLAQTCRNYKPE